MISNMEYWTRLISAQFEAMTVAVNGAESALFDEYDNHDEVDVDRFGEFLENLAQDLMTLAKRIRSNEVDGEYDAECDDDLALYFPGPGENNVYRVHSPIEDEFIIAANGVDAIEIAYDANHQYFPEARREDYELVEVIVDNVDTMEGIFNCSENGHIVERPLSSEPEACIVCGTVIPTGHVADSSSDLPF